MFRQFVKPRNLPVGVPIPHSNLTSNALELFRVNPMELSSLLELVWEFRRNVTTGELGSPEKRSEIRSLPADVNTLSPLAKAVRALLLPRAGIPATAIVLPPGNPGLLAWEHIIYAYLIENTRIYEIFRKVVHEYRHGEKLGVPLDSDSQHWLRNTEELFYKVPAPFTIYSVASDIRPDLRASRRNAYYRMFAMDLNHGMDNNKSQSYRKPDASNTEFVTTLEDLLREVWIGITNVTSTSGPRQTDNASISNLADKLHDMLMTRRRQSNLSREEFWYVSMMSWFHLTVEFDSPIVKSLRAEATTPEERLFKIAERVGLPAHARSRDFFILAEPLSRILILIELNQFQTAASVKPLYDSAIAGTLEPLMRDIITHWSFATGRDMKVRKGSEYAKVSTNGQIVKSAAAN
jgi:hypothetical protein